MEARISGTTKLFGLIGSPVSHSASPAMQNYGFQACGVDGAYLAFDIKEEEVPEFIKSMRLLNIQGCNVTMPNKTVAAQNMDELSPAAELIGAVNTIVNRDGKLYGHITDGEGFVANLKDHGISVEGKDIVIFGAGGAATAIQVQCALDGAKSITIFNPRDPFFERAQKMVEKIKAKVPACQVELYDLDAKDTMRTKIDGADKWQQLRYVTLPLLISSITISLVFNIISGFKVFAQVYSTTNGGPADSTHVLGTFLFKSFGNGFLGYSAAVGLFTTVLIVALSMTLLAILRKREVEY